MGLVSFRGPLSELVGLVLAKTDLKSVFCLVVFFIVTAVLAYLTNPTENSFRTYLTEQSFRQHLSRLDDNVDEELKEHASSSARRSAFSSTHTRSFDNPSAFHFANRASVSLRTPKHIFHSFGLFTIAAIVPSPKYAHTNDREPLMISDSWYIGAFGHWWRGGVIEAWYQDVIARSKDEEGWSSGILNMKSLDMLDDGNRLLFSTKNLPPHLLSRGAPPKLRNRDKTSQRLALPPPRSSTPPPLPKSVSLPLHTTRIPVLTPFDLLTSPPPHAPQLIHPCHPVEPVAPGSPLLSRSSSATFDHSPRIAEVLRQISLSKTTVLDLRNQLCESQTSVSQTHASLQTEVEALRERKRQEDASKGEIKARTKTLDDSKRHAEGEKKEADKKLKVARHARDSATQRIDNLDREISLLKQSVVDDETIVRRSGETISEVEKELLEALAQKKQEIKAAEDIVAALNQRARELEEKLAEEKQRLEDLNDQKRTKNLDNAAHASQNSNRNSCPPESRYPVARDPLHSPRSPAHDGQGCHQRQGSLESGVASRRSSVSSKDNRFLSRPGNIALGNTNASPTVAFSTITTAPPPMLQLSAYPVLDDNALPLPPTYRKNANCFSPFGEVDHGVPMVSPTNQSLVSSALISSFDNNEVYSRGFQSGDDTLIDRDWGTDTDALASSPVTLHRPHDYDHDPFEVRFMGQEREARHLVSHASFDVHPSWTHLSSSDPNPPSLVPGDFHQAHDTPSVTGTQENSAPRRWQSASGPRSREKPKKGLNPDAKVFSLPRKSAPASVPVSSPPQVGSFDALNPHGISSTALPSSRPGNNTSFLRAFAPSPAEREALQRALSGSSNTSLERLPSLSNVGGIPAPVHARPANDIIVPRHVSQQSLPSWLQSFPRIRKPNFSPWDDEEPMTSKSVEVVGSGRKGTVSLQY